MLRLPADLQLTIISEGRAAHSAVLTCKAFHRLLNTPESILRLYLASRTFSNSFKTFKQLAAQQHSNGTIRADRHVASNRACDKNSASVLQTVYNLLVWGRLRSWSGTEDGALRTLKLMCECTSVLKALPEHHLDALRAWQQHTSGSSTADVAAGVELLHRLLPYAEHCLLPFCAAGGHVHLVQALLPLTHTPVLLGLMVHYVKTSAFFAAAAGGQADVLSEMLGSGALAWACQLPGIGLTKTALDLAAQGGHLPAMKLLKQYVGTPNSTFLTAAADSGNGAVMEWALGFWFCQFNAVTGFSTAHIQQMHDALRVSCQAGHLAAIRQLLRYLHAVRCHDCCVLALSYTCCTSNTEAMKCILESPYLPQQLARGGPKLMEQLVMVVASCLRIAIRIHSQSSLELLLDALTSTTGPLGPARELLSPQMPSVFDQAATAGNAVALQLLLTRLPEHYCALGISALEGALSEGHVTLANTIRTLLVMRGPEEGYTPEALSAEHNAAVARVARQGQLKLASSKGDVIMLQHLLSGAGGANAAGPDDNEQLLMLRLAAAAGREEAVQLLLGEFGGTAGGPRAELCLRAVVRGAVHAGQVKLLQSLESDPTSMLLQHLAQPDSLAEYTRAALLCGRVAVAAWLVSVAARQQLLGVVRSTLQSILTTSRWELWNTGVGRSARDATAALLSALAMAPPAEALKPAEHSTPAALRIQASAATAADAIVIETPASAEGANGASSSLTAGAVFQREQQSLLNPQVLSLLLQAAAGDPAMLYSVVDLVHSSWGVKEGEQQHQWRQRSAWMPRLQQQLRLDRRSSSASSRLQQALSCRQDSLPPSPSEAAGSSGDPGRSSTLSSSATTSYTTAATTTTSKSSFTALYGTNDSAAGSRDAFGSSGGEAGHDTGVISPDSKARSWPTGIGSSKSEGGIVGGVISRVVCNDTLQSDQQQQGASVRQGHVTAGSSVQALDQVVGVVTGVGGLGCSSNRSKENSRDVLLPASHVYHPVHTPSLLQKAAAHSPFAQQQHDQLDSQQQQEHGGQRYMQEGVRSLKHLTGRVEQLSVSTPDRHVEQVQGEPNLHRESQPVDRNKFRTASPVLRTAVSVPLPNNKACPMHPYMQYYHHQQRQQQQREQRQGAAAM